MRKLLSLLLSLTLLLSLSVTAFASETSPVTVSDPAATQDMTGKTVILYSNDVHGAIEGYAYMAALKTDYEARGAEVVLVDAGDFSQGSPYVSLTKGLDAVTLMNAVGYDVVTIGNHDFDYGVAQLKDNLSRANFKIVCANVFENGKNIYDANYTHTTKSGLKLGFFGLETPEAKTKARPAIVKDLTFLTGDEMFRCAREQVSALEGCDLVICLGHLGIDKATVGNRSIDLLANVTGIDLFIDAHSHSSLDDIKAETNDDCTVNGTVLTSTGTEFNNIGVVAIDNASRKIESVSVLPTEGIAGDETIAAAAKVIVDRTDAELGQVFATSEVELNGEKAGPGNRDSETNSGDLITDALLWSILKDKDTLAVDSDHVVAIVNGGSIRAWLHAGEITKKDLNTVLPFGDTLAVVYVTGAELLEALEASTFCTPDAVGAFPQVSGIEFTLNTARAYDANPETYPGSTYYGPASIRRVTINNINGKAFDPNDTYAVVTSDFCAMGGDTYYSFASASAQFDTGILLDETVISYIQSELGGVIGKEYASPQGRIELTDNPFTDVADTAWYAPYIVSLYHRGVVSGTSATTYDPKGELTWAQALKLLLVAGGDLENAAGRSWDAEAVSRAVELGLVTADVDGSAAITRIEFCRLAAKLNNITESSSASTFSDCSDGYVTALAELSVVSGMGDGTFASDSVMTRAQGAKIVYCLDALAA